MRTPEGRCQMSLPGFTAESGIYTSAITHRAGWGRCDTSAPGVDLVQPARKGPHFAFQVVNPANQAPVLPLAVGKSAPTRTATPPFKPVGVARTRVKAADSVAVCARTQTAIRTTAVRAVKSVSPVCLASTVPAAVHRDRLCAPAVAAVARAVTAPARTRAAMSKTAASVEMPVVPDTRA